MLLCKTMKRHGVLYYHLTFQSTFSSLTIKMTSLTAELRWIVQCGPGISMWISFYCTSLRTVWLTGSLWCGRGQSFSLLLTNIWIEIRGGGIPCRTPYLSFLFASASLGKVRHFPSEAGCLSELQGLSYRGHRGLSVNSQSPGETQCYPHWPNCLHISVAFPDDIWIRKLLLNNLDSSQLTVFPINLIHSM